MEKTICELFAGVGGFRLGFERLESAWKTVWFSQWEPGASKQWAHDCYVKHFGDAADVNGEYHTSEDISTIVKENIPNHSLLVGGFPCQDYSVAHSLTTAQGIEGKKGVLWWQIRDTLIAKQPAFCIFENVDRLLKSPSKQRGRDFGVILACLDNLGYSAEWRVVNAAVYGAAQRRRRVFIFAYRNDTVYGEARQEETAYDIISESGLMAKAFPVTEVGEVSFCTIPSDIADVSDRFSFGFRSAGYMSHGVICTTDITEKAEEPILLRDVLETDAAERYYADKAKADAIEYLKSAKQITRTTADGYTYTFSEGPVPFPDSIDKPARTMLTSEASNNRSTHVINDPTTGRLRVLTPVEAERIQGFDDNWTDTGMPLRMRYFCMGNALVVPMITRMGKVLDTIIADEP